MRKSVVFLCFLFPFFVFWFVLVETVDLLKRIICDLPDVLKWPFETIESVYIAITNKKLVLAWFENYKKASEKLKHDFLNNPDDVMQIEHATNILLLGMKEGWFTGRKLSDYINQSKKDYLNARRIINGMDKASLIAGYAETFEKALRCP